MSNFEWTKKDIIVIKDGYHYTFIAPYNDYDNVSLDLRNFIKQDEIYNFAVDSKIDKNAYYNLCESVIGFNTMH